MVNDEQVSLGEGWLSDFRLRRMRATIVQRAIVLQVPVSPTTPLEVAYSWTNAPPGTSDLEQEAGL